MIPHTSTVNLSVEKKPPKQELFVSLLAFGYNSAQHVTIPYYLMPPKVKYTRKHMFFDLFQCYPVALNATLKLL